VLAQYVRAGAFADSLRESDTSDERDPVMLQIRGQNSAATAGDAEDELNRQMQRLQAQGQHYFYLPFGVVVGKRACGDGALCSVPGYVLQGGGAYGYGPIAPTGSGITTLDDRCETQWGYIPPPPPEPGLGAGGEISGSTPLVNGQGYIDVVFDTAERNSYWTFIECQVVNTTDPAPLNIWPGIVTSKTKTGFRLQLNGTPNSDHYSLSWTIKEPSGETVESVTYLFSGPTSGPIGTPTGFTVMLPPGTVVPATVTVTPSDGGAGGTFAPTSVELTNDVPTAIFTYTPVSYGAKTLSVTNDVGLEDPSPRTFTVSSDHYTLSGPSSGAPGAPSTNFTVALPAGGAVSGTMTVTPSDGGGGGTFTPTTVGLTTAAPSATFTYTPGSTGTKTISVTNNRGLTDPGNLSYIVSSPLRLWLKADAIAGPPADGTAMATWTDSSGSGNDATQATGINQPLFKTSRINSLPALLFDATDFMTVDMLGSMTTEVTVFIVQKKTVNGATLALLSTPTDPANSFAIYLPFSDGTVYFDFGNTTGTGRISATWGGDFTHFFVWSFVAGGGNMAIYRNGTSVVSSGGHTNVFASAGLTLAINGPGGVVPSQNAEIAEIKIYNTALGSTDRVAEENALKTKYGL
jgi:hypothetical protein